MQEEQPSDHQAKREVLILRQNAIVSKINVKFTQSWQCIGELFSTGKLQCRVQIEVFRLLVEKKSAKCRVHLP